MRLAIIGCGYVGSAVARIWHTAGNEVTVTTTTADRVAELRKISSQVVVFAENDLASLQQIVANQDVVLLSIGSKQRTVETYRQTYLETAQSLVKAIANSQVKQLIYTGSYGIINDKSGKTIDETVAVNPRDEFGEILRQTEQVLLSAANPDLKVCIFRLTGIYGPGRELIRIFRRVAGTTRPGEGESYTNWVHLEDIARAIDFAKDKQLNGLYHLNSDEYLTMKVFFNKLFQAHNLPPVVWDSSQTNTRGYNMKLSNAKLKNEGFSLAHPQIEFS